MEAFRALLLNDNEDTSQPLAVLYSRCFAIHAQQDALVASKDFELISAALALFLRTESAVDSVGLFSSNEDKEDLATADIKYLLLPFYRGSLLSAAPVRTDGGVGLSASRLASVVSALSALGSFLQRAEQYDLLGALASSAVSADSSEAPLDPAAKRTFKVEKFKREKALNAALGALEARRAAVAAQEREDEAAASGTGSASVVKGTVGTDDAAASASSSSAAAAVAVLAAPRAAAAGSGAGAGTLDEEDERRLWEWRVELAALQAVDLGAALKQEMELLQHAANREAAAAAAGPGPSSSSSRPDGRNEAAGSAPGEREQMELMTRLRAICRDLDGNKREQIRQNVFKPGHILPTMTVEEAGEIEAREAAEREARQRKQEEKERARRAALDSDEEDAEDKAKQRAFDDWRDAHPKGYGNSKLRPCG